MQPREELTVTVHLQSGAPTCKHSIDVSDGLKKCIIDKDPNGICPDPGDVIKWHGDGLYVNKVHVQALISPCEGFRNDFKDNEGCTISSVWALVTPFEYKYDLTTSCTEDPKMIVQNPGDGLLGLQLRTSLSIVIVLALIVTAVVLFFRQRRHA